MVVTKAPAIDPDAAAAPAEQADAAEHHGDDRGQRVAVAGRRVAGGGGRGQEQAGGRSDMTPLST